MRWFVYDRRVTGHEDASSVEGRAGRWRWLPEGGIPRTLLEIGILIPCYFLYQAVRGTVSGRSAEAFQRAGRLIDVEQALGIFREAELQSLILTWDIAVRFVNFVYLWGHLPVIIVVAVWLFIFHRHRYSLFRNAFIISGGIGLLLFWLLPTAPPRFLPSWGFVDTVVYDGSYYILQSPAFVNQYAAIPSLHFGWSLLAAVAVFANLRGTYRYLVFLLPVLSLGGVVLTANHFFLDAVAGAAVALFGLLLAMIIRARLPRQRPFTVLA